MRFDPLNNLLYQRFCRMGEETMWIAKDGIENAANTVLGYLQEQAFSFANVLPFELLEERVGINRENGLTDTYPTEREITQTNYLGI